MPHCTEVINLSVQKRITTKQDGTASAGGRGGRSAAAAAAAAGGGGSLGRAPSVSGGGSEGLFDNYEDLMDIDGGGAAAGTQGKAAARRGKAAAAGGMPPPAPKGRQRKGAAAAAASAGGLRQANLAEAFARGSQGGGGLASPQGKTGSNLNGLLTSGAAAAGGGGSTPSQGTSSRSRAGSGSAARGGKGSRGGRGSRGGARGGKRGAAASQDVLSSDEEAAGAEGISSESDGGEQRPAKKARGELAAPVRWTCCQGTRLYNGAL
jgi:hypothetical protein